MTTTAPRSLDAANGEAAGPGSSGAAEHADGAPIPATELPGPVAAPAPEGTPADAPPDPPLYVLQGVTKQYRARGGTITPLTGVDLTVAPGEFLTIQGPTGGGKSTLLQLLGALDRPTSGTIALNDTQLGTASAAELTRIRATQLGFVFQAFNLIHTLTAAENVNVALEARGALGPAHAAPGGKREIRAELVREALAKVGLADRADHRPGELSGGQQQRVAIARAIVTGPRVLLADEPTGNLDEAMRDEILTLLEGLNREGLTIIAVTHDTAVARRADRRLRLENGTLHEL
ncbi:peptide ABC transporter ATP-binding protein [Leucobacter massiliensis]|uniref:Peptide ABC transporter ATP-binding protein n=2 Tax=Leucobacter massiliensis TaxID=1686285 RepID=A0A2S9QR52_9MICO|nr:peptide ABC transporter ATP-binding protein [Leucobacter massiliensis]